MPVDHLAQVMLDFVKGGLVIYPLSPARYEPIGVVELDGIEWIHGSAWVGIGLGEKEYWG